jgi:hypothetical protein
MSMRHSFKNYAVSEVFPKFEDWANLLDYLDNNKEIKVCNIPGLTDDYLILSNIVRNFFNMEISERTIQRIVYEEFKPAPPLDIRSLIHVNPSDKTGFSEKEENMEPGIKKNETENINNLDNKDEKNIKSKNLLLFDEQKLALRFKDDEIKDIINIINENIKKIGSKYLVEPECSFDFKKSNNTIQINIELKQI